MALAAPGPEASNPAVINPLAEVQLSIHKFLGAPVSATPPDGTLQTVSGRDRVAGVSFAVYRVGNVDLTTNAGWLAASALSGHQVTAAEIAAGKITVGGVDYPLVSQGIVVTDAAGVAVFTRPNGVGLYLVAEVVEAVGWYPCPPESSMGSTCYKNVESGAPVVPRYVTASAPFLVTLPLTNPTGTTAQQSWLYDVHVYPKNNAETITKTVQDKWTVAQRTYFRGSRNQPNDPNNPLEGLNGPYPAWQLVYPEFNGEPFFGTSTNHPEAAAGKDEIIYTLTSSISAGLTGPQMARYEVKDRLVVGLAFDSVSVKITNATATGAEKVLTAPTDYTVSIVPAPAAATLCTGVVPDWGSNPCGQDVTVSMTAAGLVELAAAKAANPAAQVVTVIKAKLVGVPMHRMSISNLGANFVPSQAWWDQHQDKYQAGTADFAKGVQGPWLESEYFGVKIIKKDPTVAADAQPALTGAEFALFAGGDPVARKCVASDVSGKQPVATAVVTNKKPDGSNLTSGVGFNATMITGLKSSNSFNGEVQIPESRRAEYLSYCLVETKAPAGYTLNPEPIYVEGLRKSWIAPMEYPPLTYTHVSVANQKANLGNQLPLTGGAGAAALGIAGVLLIGGGIGYYTITARRRRS